MPAPVQRLLRRLSGDSPERLPARIQRLIRQQQESSEVLIGWIQLGVVGTFAVLYALAPKTFNSADTFAPVPWALGGYFLFTVIRLLLAHRKRLPDWFLYLSIVLDIGLLLGLIWSFHLQYGQPASFYLKVPTLLYVFIFIALRSLRFEARFVAITGLAAALGWLAMVGYAVAIDPRNPMITRDYVHYLTSNSILLGAEFDKVISILTVTAILAVAISRGRALLVRSVVDSSAARDLARFVPKGVSAQLAAAEQEAMAGQGELREVTILFSDIEGFTGLSERLPPKQLIAVLNEYFAVVTAPIERHGGVINNFIGDAILATFNLPESRPDHAAAAVQAALEILALLDQRTFGDGIVLKSRIGINTGTAVGGLVGTTDRLVYTIYGDEVNLAARLEQLNKEYGTRLMVSERTCELAGRDRFPFQFVDKVMARGRKAKTTLYTLS
ncbi:MAG: adenylate/guanylate cyclase domain-containing protein [Pseudomonadota bacterium]|nr:adenylate/guanylate cyclase domain-containing protein [Pseudomonadota bacterium]